jgi:hypothetical protein
MKTTIVASPVRHPFPTLEEVMAYRHPDVVARFLKSWNVPQEEAEAIFDDLKRWLWVSAVSKKDELSGEPILRMAILNSMALVDDMWHAFILFTKDYTKFCIDYFGFYLHHGPTTLAQKEEAMAAIEADPVAFQAKLTADFEAQLSYIYDKLGPEVLTRWYSEWTDKVTQAYIDSIAIPFRL